MSDQGNIFIFSCNKFSVSLLTRLLLWCMIRSAASNALFYNKQNHPDDFPDTKIITPFSEAHKSVNMLNRKGKTQNIFSNWNMKFLKNWGEMTKKIFLGVF